MVTVVCRRLKPNNGGIQMNYTQNMKILQVKKETLVVGVDIGSEEHYARAFDWLGIELAKVFRFENTEKGFLNS